MWNAVSSILTDARDEEAIPGIGLKADAYQRNWVRGRGSRRAISARWGGWASDAVEVSAVPTPDLFKEL